MQLLVDAVTIPTDEPESDGTLEWDSTTVVIVRAAEGGETGIGYTYCDRAAAELIRSTLADAVRDVDPLDVRVAWLRMGERVRNSGRPGVAFCAISAVDQAI